MPMCLWRAEEGKTLISVCENVEKELGPVINIVPLTVQAYRDKTITIEAAIVYTKRASTSQFE